MAATRLRSLIGHIEKLSGGPCERQGTDRQLLDDFAARHDETAFAELVGRHGPLVLRVCRRVLHHEQDAEDAFQATFLVLAKCFGSIRKREALADWLHGVAYRTAMKAKRSAARRRNHEAQMRTWTLPPAASPTWDDVQTVLDEEIQRLPASFRAAFVLCVLEGKTVPAAAAELQCKEGTVSSRLARARQRLQKQLARRGIELAALLAAVCVAETGGVAAVPAMLCHSAVRMALLVAAGGTAAAAIPPHVAALATGVTRAMFMQKAKLAVIVVLTLGLFAASAGVLTRQLLNAEEKGTVVQTAVKPPAEPAKPAKDTIEVTGRVLDQKDKPVAGARIYLIGSNRRNADPIVATDAEGKFHFVVKPEEVGFEGRVLAARDGDGPDWVNLASCEKGAVTLRLRKDDVPFAGRIFTLEGQPIVGATVEAERLGKPADGDDLKLWLDNNVKQRKEGSHVNEVGLVSVVPSTFGARLTATTDQDGKFRLTGAGRDRVLTVRVQGKNIEHKFFWVVTRPDAPKDGYIKTGGFNFGLYGPELTVLVGPSKPIVGTLRDHATGKPLAGIKVEEVHFQGLGARLEQVRHSITNAITDAKGHYRLDGVAKKESYFVVALGQEGIPYFDTAHTVKDTAGFDPITVDFTMNRGLEFTGRVLDKDTGKPIAGKVRYSEMLDNPHLKDYPPTNDGEVKISNESRIRPDGTYVVLAIPGTGALSVSVDARDRYPSIPPQLKKLKLRSFPDDYSHAVFVVDLDETKRETHVYDFKLTRGKSRNGIVFGPDDKPLEGVQAAGLNLDGDIETMKAATFQLTGLGERKRILVFIHPEKNLGSMTVIGGDSEEAIRVKLQPLGSVQGQVLDAEGKPWVKAKLTLWIYAQDPDNCDNLPRGFANLQGMQVPNRMPWPKFVGREAVTDNNGHFRLENVLPGVECSLYVGDGGNLAKEGILVARRFGIRVEPGKATDLGAIKRGDGMSKN